MHDVRGRIEAERVAEKPAGAALPPEGRPEEDKDRVAVRPHLVAAVPPDRRYPMELFYRRLRRALGILVDDRGAPVGGRWNYDELNRRPLPRGEAPPPVPAGFVPDTLTRAVMREVEREGHGVGSTAGFDLAVTRTQARAALADFLEWRLARFGPYEDAMRSDVGVLYHSRLSPYLNLGLLDPEETARAAEDEYRAGRAPIASVEGFVRQVIGWREYMWWQYWRLMPALRAGNAWDAHRDLPGFFRDGETDMRCLRHALGRTLATGYTHHIERLMLLANFCLLAGAHPRAATDWFLAAYVDVYDWVMQPNVVGMGLNADGGLVATKPYVASAAYIHRMSDYCGGCRYDRGRRTGPDACPFNTLYWNFLLTHERRLRANPRLGPAVLGRRRLGAAERRAVRTSAEGLLARLDRA
jgi:deoxyribodipyrimidine photolyase-related protein